MKSFNFKISTPMEDLYHNVYYKKEMEITKWDGEIIYLWRSVAQKCGGGINFYNRLS